MQKFKTGIESEAGSEFIMVVFRGNIWFEDEYGQIEAFTKELILFAAEKLKTI